MASTNRFRGSVNLDGENYIFYFHYLLVKFSLPLNNEYRQLSTVLVVCHNKNHRIVFKSTIHSFMGLEKEPMEQKQLGIPMLR